MHKYWKVGYVYQDSYNPKCTLLVTEVTDSTFSYILYKDSIELLEMSRTNCKYIPQPNEYTICYDIMDKMQIEKEVKEVFNG